MEILFEWWKAAFTHMVTRGAEEALGSTFVAQAAHAWHLVVLNSFQFCTGSWCCTKHTRYTVVVKDPPVTWCMSWQSKKIPRWIF